MEKYLKKDQIIIYDNLISVEESNQIKNIMLNDGSFPWYIQTSINTIDYNTDEDTSDNNTFEYIQLIHRFLHEDKPNSAFMPIANFLINTLETNLGKKLVFSRIKANLQTKVTTGRKTYNSPHIDSDLDHLVMLYYVNDSDSKTYIFKNDKKPWIIEKEIDSVQGRFVLFNGKNYHSGSHPIDGVRVVINFNIMGIED